MTNTAELNGVHERTTAVHWFRSDLRLSDNVALSRCSDLSSHLVTLFILDDSLLSSDRQSAARIQFMLKCLERLAAELAERGQRLLVRRGEPLAVLREVVAESGARVVTWNRDTGVFARSRDERVARGLAEDGVRVETFKDRVIHEARDIAPIQNRSLAVFSPYRKAWWHRFEEHPPDPATVLRLPPPPERVDYGPLPIAAVIDSNRLSPMFDGTRIPEAGELGAERRLRSFLAGDIRRYKEARDFPAEEATSRLSAYLRFGVISIRTCFREARSAAESDSSLQRGAKKWIDELIWREFYQAIVDDDPSVLHRNYRREFDDFEWEQDDEGFEAWRQGRTGFPFVDAGIRELLTTGHMHNRLRMVVASFLTKDLLIDWRRGERFFMEHLVDGDPASNNGGWQWAASTGTDAQSFLRVFNPVLQGDRFDPDGEYVRRWIPELEALAGGSAQRPWEQPLLAPSYPAPILDHGARKRRAIERYSAFGG